jgi:glycosyltransferase involved in cell wall biosynthesis
MNFISATVLTRNEEERLEACLNSLVGVADEIILVDSFSTDKTIEIAQRYKCKITQRHFNGYGSQRQYATSLTTFRYVLSLDADEVLSDTLRNEIIKLKHEGFKHRVYSISRLNYYCGHPIKHSGWFPDNQIRLFNKRYANWNLRDVGERVIFPDSLRPAQLDGNILHYRCTTPEELNTKESRHAGIRGRIIAGSSSKISFLTPLFKGIASFFSSYIAKAGYLDGNDGFEIAKRQYQSAYLSYNLARRILKKNRI